jgi:tight adherence protein B
MLLWICLFVVILVVALGGAGVVLLVMQRAGRSDRLKEALARTDMAPEVTFEIDTAPPARSRLEQFVEWAGAGEGSGAAAQRPALVAAAMAAGAALGLAAGFALSDIFTSAAIPLAAAGGAYVPVWYLRRGAARRIQALEEQLPDTLDFLARSVRSGSALSVALEMAVPETPEPLRSELVRITREQTLGASLESALRGLVRRNPLVELRFFVAAVLLHRETGGNLPDILTKLGQSVRERLRLGGQVRAASAQGKMTARVLTILPVVVVAGMQFISPTYFRTMTGNPAGRVMLIAAVISQSLGYYIMMKIVDIEV